MMASHAWPAGSLRVALTRRLTIALAILGTAGAMAAYAMGSRFANTAYDRGLFDNVVVLGEQVSATPEGVLVDVPPAAMRWLLADEGEQVLFRVVDLSRQRVVAGNGDLGPMVDAGDLAPARAYFRSAVVGGRSYRISYAKQFIGAARYPVLVEVGETTVKRQAMASGILAGTVLLMLTMIVVAVGMVWQGVGSSLSALRMLEVEAARRSGSDLTPLDPALAPAEVRGLIDAINRMMFRVNQTLSAQRRFMANAAHQLRTPVAGVRLLAQIAAKSSTLDAVRRELAEVESSADRAAHVIEQLLTLSKAESADGIEPVPVDLEELAAEVIGRFIDQADRKGVDLGFDGNDHPGLRILANRVLIGELLGNLVDNAIRYSRRGDRVTVATDRFDGQVIVSVRDTGPGFDARVAGSPFQRFAHRDSASPGGAGLGLAIVKEIADRHGASVNIDSSVDGSEVRIRFGHMASSPAAGLAPLNAAAA